VAPVPLNLCSQLELDLAVTRANQRQDRQVRKAEKRGERLRPIEETTAAAENPEAANPDEGAPAPDEYKLSAELEQD
jgi:hypothetical protein